MCSDYKTFAASNSLGRPQFTVIVTSGALYYCSSLSDLLVCLTIYRRGGGKLETAEHKIRVFGQTKTGLVGHLSEQRHVWSGHVAVQLSELNH